MSDPPPGRTLRPRTASGQAAPPSSSSQGPSQLDAKTPTSRTANQQLDPPVAGPSSTTSKRKAQQPLPPPRPSKKRSKKFTVRPTSDLSPGEVELPPEYTGEEEGVTISRRRKGKGRASNEEDGQNGDEAEEEGKPEEEEEEEIEEEEHTLEGSNRIRMAAAEDLLEIDEMWREKERPWSERLPPTQFDLSAHVQKERNPLLYARYANFSAELLTFKRSGKKSGGKTVMGRLVAVKDRELHDQRLSKLRTGFWIAATALAFVCVSAQELYSALKSAPIRAFIDLSDDDFDAQYQMTSGATAVELARDWRQSNPLPSNSKSPVLFDQILLLLMEDMKELKEAEYIEGSIIRMTGPDDKPFKDPKVALRVGVFDASVARPLFFEFCRLLPSAEFDEYRQIPRLRSVGGPESRREPYRIQIYPNPDMPPRISLPLWASHTRMQASGQSRQTKGWVLIPNIVEAEITPSEDRVLGIYGTVNGITYDWEQDFEKIVSQTRNSNAESAKELVKWKGPIFTILSFLNNVFKATPRKDVWSIPDETALNDHLFNVLYKAFPKPGTPLFVAKAYYPPSLLRERHPAIYGGKLVSAGQKTSGSRTDRVILRNVPTMSRAGIVSRVASLMFSESKDIPGCDKLVAAMALGTFTFSPLSTSSSSSNESNRKLSCHDCQREDCEFVTCKIAGFAVYLCHRCHQEYVASAESVSTETGKDNVNRLQIKMRSEGVLKTQIQIRQELSASKGIDVSKELQISEAYFGLTMVNISPTMALNSVMSSFDCVSPIPSEDGKSILLHGSLINVVYTTWPINAILASLPRQILPLFAILIALRSRLHSAQSVSDLETFKAFESIAQRVIDQVLPVVVKMHSAHRAIDLPINKDATTLEVSEYFGENPAAYHLAKRQVYDNILGECVEPNEHLLPGSQEWYRRNISWMTSVPASEVDQYATEIRSEIDNFVADEKDGAKLACITDEMVNENMLPKDDWRKIEDTTKKLAAQFEKSGNCVYTYCSGSSTVVSFLHPDEQKDWEKKTGRKWTVAVQHYHLVARGLRMQHDCDRTYQDHPDSDPPATRLQKAIITFFYQVYETNWSDPIVGRVKLVDRGSLNYGGFGHGRQRRPMTSILEGDSLSYDSINPSKVPKPNIVLRTYKLTRQLSRSLQAVEDHNKDFAPNENIKIFGRAVEDIFRHGRYKGISKAEQVIVADQLKDGLDDETIRSDEFLRNVGLLPPLGALSYEEALADLA